MNSPAPAKSIYITANSPGEIAGWVLPVVEKLKAKDPSVGVTLVITPCQYASGLEAEVAATLPGVDRIVRVGALMRLAVFGRERPGPGSLVLFLGGDMLYAAWLSKLLKVPAWAYTSSPRRRKHFAKYLVGDDSTRQRFANSAIEPDRVQTVGHLVLDSIRISASREEIINRLTGGSEDIVTFLPGSRPDEVRHMAPFFIEAAELLSRTRPVYRVFFAVSPFADRRLLARSVEQAGFRLDGDDIITPGGLHIGLVARNQHDVMSVSKLVVTIPGTNNLQIAAMGVPMLIVTPLHRAELIPLEGLLGLLNPKIPPIGWLKRKLIQSRASHLEYVSLPNTLAGRHLAPEMLGIFRPGDVAARALELLDQPERNAEVCRELQGIIGERGAAERMASALLQDNKLPSGSMVEEA